MRVLLRCFEKKLRHFLDLDRFLERKEADIAYFKWLLDRREQVTHHEWQKHFEKGSRHRYSRFRFGQKRSRHCLRLRWNLGRRDADITSPRGDFGQKRSGHDRSWCVFIDRREPDIASLVRTLERREETAHEALSWCFKKMRRNSPYIGSSAIWESRQNRHIAPVFVFERGRSLFLNCLRRETGQT